MTSTEIQWNWEVVGNKNIVEFLQNNIVKDSPAHAYLFVGPEKIGKKMAVENFTKSLLCADKNNRPCGKCNNCRQIEKGVHPDFFYLNRAKDKKNISIEQARELQGKLSLGSFSNSYKIAVIDGADSLSIEAANSLLKTLEEPTRKTILILIAQRTDALPETIFSRCQVLKFLPVAEKDIFNHLIKRGVERYQAKILARLSFGRPGMAIELFDNKELLAECREKTEEFFSLSNGGIGSRFEIIDGLANTKIEKGVLMKNLDFSLNMWTIIIRDMLYIKDGLEGLIGNLDFSDKLKQLSHKYSKEQLVKLFGDLYEMRRYLTENVNPKLVLENFVLNL